MARPDFTNVWGSTNAPFTAITDTDYKAGWVFRTGAPPRRVNFDYWQNLADQRMVWLAEQIAVIGQNIAVFTASGVTNWTVPDILKEGTVKANVKVVGGGGGGARRSVSPGASGGGGGGVSEELIDLTGVTTVTITVGAGGAGSSIDGNNGLAGASSSFGAYCSATGGAAGTFTGNASLGGVGVGGTLNYRLGDGNVAITGGAGAILGGSGGGGESPFATVDNNTPITPGMGGGGRTTAVAASGANGIVIVRW